VGILTDLIEFRKQQRIKKQASELEQQIVRQDAALAQVQTGLAEHTHDDYVTRMELPKPYVHPKAGVCPQKPQLHVHNAKDILDLAAPKPYDVEQLRRDHPQLREPYLHDPKKHGHLASDLIGKIQPIQIEPIGLDADTLDRKHASDLVAEITKKVKKVYVGGGPLPIGDWIPDADGRFLGEDTTPKRWNGSKLTFPTGNPDLDNRYVQSGLEKIVDIMTTSDVTSIVVDNLDLNAAKAYLLLFRFRNAYGNACSFALYFNDVTSGYTTQQMYSSGSSTASGNLGATSRYTYAYGSQRVTNEGLLMRTPDNYTLTMSRSFPWTGSASTIFFHNVHWNNTANPTKLEIRGEYNYSIASGSKLMIFKVKG